MKDRIVEVLRAEANKRDLVEDAMGLHICIETEEGELRGIGFLPTESIIVDPELSRAMVRKIKANYMREGIIKIPQDAE